MIEVRIVDRVTDRMAWDYVPITTFQGQWVTKETDLCGSYGLGDDCFSVYWYPNSRTRYLVQYCTTMAYLPAPPCPSSECSSIGPAPYLVGPEWYNGHYGYRCIYPNYISEMQVWECS